MMLNILINKMPQTENINPHDPLLSPAWVQYEQLRLARLQQQRQRMQSMKEVIEKYSTIIANLQEKNKQLVDENQQYKSVSEQLTLENQEMRVKNEQLMQQLSEQVLIRNSLQNTVRELKQDISIMTMEFGNNRQDSKLWKRQPETNQEGFGLASNINYQIEYETLQQLYQGMKKQYYLLNKQNHQLKNVLHAQSKRHTKRSFQIPPNHTNGMDKSNKTYYNQNLKQKNKQLKIQIMKQEALIEKFRKTEEQQQELIQILKKNKNKVCACHTSGVKSSKKLISIKNIEESYGKS